MHLIHSVHEIVASERLSTRCIDSPVWSPSKLTRAWQFIASSDVAGLSTMGSYPVSAGGGSTFTKWNLAATSCGMLSSQTPGSKNER